MEIIKLNLIPSGVNPTCHAKQYDKGRIIRFELFNGLTPYTLQSGDTVTLNLRKPDNTIIEASVTATQGNKYVDLVTTEQMCAVAGYNLGTFKIVNGETDIGTLNFIMAVERDVLADGVPSQSVIEDLDALVSEAVEADIGDNYYTKTQIDNSNYRAIKVNGTEQLSNGTSSGAVDFVEGDNINITFDSNGNKIEVEADIIDDTQALTTKAWSGSKVNGLAIPNHKTATSLFVGNGAGENNTESGGDNGKYNTSLGVNTLRDNTTGDHNTAVGFQTMQYNQTGNGNTAFGEDALYSNVSGNGNTAIGVHALQKATGAASVAIGQSALIDQTSGFFNTAIGNEVGKGSGVPITTDYQLTLIGNRAGKNASTEISNSTAIGNVARVDKSNQIVLGNMSVTELVFGNYVFEFNEDHTVTWRSRT